jgi:hypothetical protein
MPMLTPKVSQKSIDFSDNFGKTLDAKMRAA